MKGYQYSSNPASIWNLPEHLRTTAVTDMFRRLAEDYLQALARGDAKGAQFAARGAINVIAGLFPDRDDPAHHLVHGLVGAFVAAAGGSTDHILLKAGSRIAGTRGGYGVAHIAGFAVAATNVLHDRGMSKLAARKAVAKILSAQGLSLRSGEHGQPKPVTWSAIRRWEENRLDYPIAAADTPAMQATIEHDVAANGLSTTLEVVGLIADHAEAFVPITLAY